jgi:hypothetical protein
MLSSPDPALWFRLSNRLNDPYDLRPVGSHLDAFGSIGVFCMSESATSAPMWAHYGSNGEGVVLEFSTSSNFFETYPALKVRYRARRPSVRDAVKALVTKNREWKYEREWRCFVDLPATRAHANRLLMSHQAISVPLDPAAITAIIHGPDSKVDATKFLQRSDAGHIREFVCRLDSWKYGLSIRGLDNIDHIFEQSEAAIWGARQRRR